MTPYQTLLVEQSERREKVNTILAVEVEKRTDEQKEDLVKSADRLKAIEPDLRAAIVADEAGKAKLANEFSEDTEGAELRQLIAGSSIGAVFSAAVEHRATEGRTAELQAHYKVNPNQIPLALLRKPVEERAVTPAPSTVGASQAEITPGVFPMSAAEFLGIDMPTVGVGDAVYPVLTTNATVAALAENAPGTETTGAFTADLLTPARLQASFFYSREDRARFAGMDASLRQNLGDALADKLDDEILTGTNGLLTGTILDNNNVTAITTYALYRSQFAYGRVDGTYAGTVADIRSVMGAATYGHAAAQFRSDNAGDRAALEDLMTATGGVRVSAHVPAVASHRQNSVIRLGMRRDYVAPMWEGVTLIPDEITKAANGQIVITAVMLYAIKLLRAGGFYKQQTQHA